MSFTTPIISSGRTIHYYHVKSSRGFTSWIKATQRPSFGVFGSSTPHQLEFPLLGTFSSSSSSSCCAGVRRTRDLQHSFHASSSTLLPTPSSAPADCTPPNIHKTTRSPPTSTSAQPSTPFTPSTSSSSSSTTLTTSTRYNEAKPSQHRESAPLNAIPSCGTDTSAAPGSDHPKDDPLNHTSASNPSSPLEQAPLSPTLSDRLEPPHTPKGVTRERVPLPETKWSDTPFNARVFDLFKLINFNKDELSRVFDRVDKNKNGLVEYDELLSYVREIGRRDDRERVMSDRDISQFADELMAKLDTKGHGGVSRAQFDKVILGMARTVDPRVWPVTLSMVMTGVAVGVVIPVMPLFVKSMGLSSADFGMVVSSFGLSKLLGNIPCAFLSDRFGRKKVMTAGAGLMALGMAGTGLASNLPELMLARLITGFGASGFTTASMLYLMDIGTPFTRTKTMAPISAGFSAGAALGPAVGGFLAHNVGLSATFSMVGASFLAIMALNHRILVETVPNTPPDPNKPTPTLASEIRETVRQWRPLLADQQFASVLGINLMYWLALSGSYMTLLPLMLVRDELGLSSAEVGGVFAMTSAVSVVCTPPSAAIADKFGKPPAIVVSSAIVASAMFMFPWATQITPALGILAMWSLGGTMFGMAPTAHVTDIVPSENRSQALALLRTTGDVGLLLGASCTGFLAHQTDPGFAMQSNAMLLLACGTAFGVLSHRHGLLKCGGPRP